MVVCLSMTTEPWSGSVVPRMMEKRVDLPAPLGPTRAMRSPRLMLSDTSSKSVRAPKLLPISDRVSIAGKARRSRAREQACPERSGAGISRGQMAACFTSTYRDAFMSLFSVKFRGRSGRRPSRTGRLFAREKARRDDFNRAKRTDRRSGKMGVAITGIRRLWHESAKGR